MGDYPRHPSGRLLFPWEIPSRPGGGVSPLAGEPGPNPLVNTPDWMRGALRLKGDEVPTLLWLPNIQPVIETFQGGWGLARYVTLTGTQPFSQPGGGINLIDPDPDPDLALVHRILAVDLIHTGGIAAGRVTYAISGVTRSAVNIAPSTVLATDDIFSAGHPIIVPPGFTFRFNFPATGVGESYVTNVLAARAPAGFPLAL